MFSKVAILFATLVAVNASALLHGAALAHTGKSVTSRHQDAHGNYAFGYDVVDGGHASSKSQSEVGNGHGFKKSAYNSHINHVAPVAVAHAAPIAVGHVAAAPLVAGHGLIGAGPVGYGYGNGLIGAGPVGYGYGNGLIGAGALGYGYGNGLVGAGALGYGGHGLLGGVAYGAAKSIHY